MKNTPEPQTKSEHFVSFSATKIVAEDGVMKPKITRRTTMELKLLLNRTDKNIGMMRTNESTDRDEA